MEARLNYAKAAPGGYQAMAGLERYLHQCGLEESLIHLIKLRASQINGCAYCLDMHWKDLRTIGERANAHTTPSANAPLWRGRRPSP